MIHKKVLYIPSHIVLSQNALRVWEVLTHTHVIVIWKIVYGQLYSIGIHRVYGFTWILSSRKRLETFLLVKLDFIKFPVRCSKQRCANVFSYDALLTSLLPKWLSKLRQLTVQSNYSVSKCWNLFPQFAYFCVFPALFSYFCMLYEFRIRGTMLSTDYFFKKVSW